MATMNISVPDPMKDWVQAQIDEDRNALLEQDREKQTELRKQRDEAIREILLEIEKVIQDYAKNESYDLILTDKVLVFGNETLEITDQIRAVTAAQRRKRSRNQYGASGCFAGLRRQGAGEGIQFGKPVLKALFCKSGSNQPVGVGNDNIRTRINKIEMYLAHDIRGDQQTIGGPDGIQYFYAAKSKLASQAAV